MNCNYHEKDPGWNEHHHSSSTGVELKLWGSTRRKIRLKFHKKYSNMKFKLHFFKAETEVCSQGLKLKGPRNQNQLFISWENTNLLLKVDFSTRIYSWFKFQSEKVPFCTASSVKDCSDCRIRNDCWENIHLGGLYLYF